MRTSSLIVCLILCLTILASLFIVAAAYCEGEVETSDPVDISDLKCSKVLESEKSAEKAGFSTPTDAEIEVPGVLVKTDNTKPLPVGETSLVGPENASQGHSEHGVVSVGYLDVPLDDNLQLHIFNTCEKYGIEPELVFGVIQKESTFRPNAMGDEGCSYGLMQVQKRCHEERMARLGCTNLLDPYQNITVGVDYLAELISTGNSIEWVLMAYNGGPGYANRNASRGVVSTYARTVLQNIENLNGR